MVRSHMLYSQQGCELKPNAGIARDVSGSGGA